MTSTDPRDGDVAQLSINTLRFLAVDMVEKAKSGHPGAPLGQAAMAWLLWTRFLRHDPADPLWPNRDRFILSCGHASALLYGLLHLAASSSRPDSAKAASRSSTTAPGCSRRTAT